MSKYVSYSNEIIDQLSIEVKEFESLRNRISKKDLEEFTPHFETRKMVIKDIKSAVKFKISSCDQILPTDLHAIDVLKSFVDVVNLPFDFICLEFEEFSVPYLVLAKQEGDYVYIYVVHKSENWQLMENSITNELVSIRLHRTDFNPWVTGVLEIDDQELVMKTLTWLYHVPFRAVVNLLCVLSCSNAHIDEHPEKPSRLKNDMRKKKNKLPFFEFKTLTIDSNKNEVKAKNTGKHASHRVHLRRGHIRRLKTKNIWVNACVVGDKSIGEIKKDYLIK